MTTERRKGERHFLGGHETPYSKGLMARALTAVGVTEEASYELARRTEADLAQRGEVTVDLDRLAELAVDLLGDERGRRAVRQLRRYRDLQELDLPVILLVGGGTGTGKSTVATEVAYRLGITRTTRIQRTVHPGYGKPAAGIRLFTDGQELEPRKPSSDATGPTTLPRLRRANRRV